MQRTLGGYQTQKLSVLQWTRKCIQRNKLTSGHLAKPKYNKVHFPSKVRFVTRFPSRSTRDQSPPIAGLPAVTRANMTKEEHGKAVFQKVGEFNELTSCVFSLLRYSFPMPWFWGRELTAPESILNRKPAPFCFFVLTLGEKLWIRTPARLTWYLPYGMGITISHE